MNRKLAVLIIIPILAVVAIYWHNASAAFVDEKSIFYGKQGIFIPGGYSKENVSLNKVSQNEPTGAAVKFNRPLLELEFRNNDGSKVNIPFAMTYVIYTLSRSEIKQWENGELSIYYRDISSHAWQSCPTTAVNGTLNGEASTSLFCVAPQATLFGLGAKPSK